MAKEVTMPKMGYDMTEGTIAKWLKKVGDSVSRGEPIAEIETDKVTIEVESFDAGTLQRILVEERRWLTEEEFLAALTLCRILPGANQVNMAVYVGTRFRGLAGAAAALAGLTLVPLALVLTLGAAYFSYRHTPGLQAVMTGPVAAAAGMTLSVGVKLGLAMRQPIALALAAAAFAGVAILRWPLLLVLAGLAPIGIAWYWPRARAEERPRA